MAESKNLKLRFAVGSIDGPRSNIWTVTSHRSDIYVSGGISGKAAKLSFHESKICRRAFHEEHTPITLSNRLMHEWRRADTPPTATGRACLLLQLRIATDFLSTALDKPRKMVTWIAPAPVGQTRVILLLLTNDTEERLRFDISAGHQLIAYKRLANGEAVAAMTGVENSSEKDFAIPSSHHQKRHIIVSAVDSEKTGRPIRIFAQNNPKDGDCQDVWELGGYYHDGPLPTGVDLFVRSRVFATQDTPTRSVRLRMTVPNNDHAQE